jgi:hypothetical protein
LVFFAPFAQILFASFALKNQLTAEDIHFKSPLSIPAEKHLVIFFNRTVTKQMSAAFR